VQGVVVAQRGQRRALRRRWRVVQRTVAARGAGSGRGAIGGGRGMVGGGWRRGRGRGSGGQRRGRGAAGQCGVMGGRQGALGPGGAWIRPEGGLLCARLGAHGKHGLFAVCRDVAHVEHFFCFYLFFPI